MTINDYIARCPRCWREISIDVLSSCFNDYTCPSCHKTTIHQYEIIQKKLKNEIKDGVIKDNGNQRELK